MKKIFVFIVLNYLCGLNIYAQFSSEYTDISYSNFNENSVAKQIYSNFLTDSLKDVSNRFALGYSASLGLLLGFDLYALLKTPPMSYELSWSLSFGLNKDKNYEGLGLKMMRQFAEIKKASLSFYYFAATYLYLGKEGPLELFRPQGSVYLGLNAGIGSENYDGYFIEVGCWYLDKALIPNFRAGKRYYLFEYL